MKKNENEWILFSDMLKREMRDPEFRMLYEELDEEDLAIRASIDARLKAKKLKEDNLRATSAQRFAI